MGFFGKWNRLGWQVSISYHKFHFRKWQFSWWTFPKSVMISPKKVWWHDDMTMKCDSIFIFIELFQFWTKDDRFPTLAEICWTLSFTNRPNESWPWWKVDEFVVNPKSHQKTACVQRKKWIFRGDSQPVIGYFQVHLDVFKVIFYFFYLV